MFQLLSRLFDTSGFPARWSCGLWSDELGWLHITSDIAIFAAYLTIPALLGYFAWKKRDVPFPFVIWLFCAFILACGTVHLVEAIIFWSPIYRLSGLIKACTAVVSWATVAAMVPVIPRAFAMRFPHEVRAEVDARTAALSRTVEAQQLLASIIESSVDAILSKDLDGRVLSWNKGCEVLYGYTADQAIGTHIQELVEAPGHADLDQIMATVRGGEQVGRHETVRRTSDGRLIEVALTVSPILDRDGRVVGASTIARDIGPRKRAEREAREANEALRKRHEEMETFVYTVSHDLKSPLVTVSGFTDVLHEELASRDPQAARDALDRIDGAVTRMSRLIEDVLEVSRAGTRAEQPETVDLAAVATDAVERLHQPIADAGARVVVRALPQLWIDPMWASQILENLLSNAVRYGCPEPGMTVEVGAEVHADAVELWVRDHGPGIPPAHQERVFDLFVRLEQDKNGTGLGLAVVDRLVARVGGHAWIDPSRGDGATFRVRLPQR